MPLFVVAVVVLVFAAPPPAMAAGIFHAASETFWGIGRSIVDDLGAPVTFAAASWALIAFKFRLGGAATAIGVALSGVLLMNLETIVSTIWKG